MLGRPARYRSLLLALFVLAGAGTIRSQSKAIGFDDLVAGAPPPGFVFAAQRLPHPGIWEVRGSGIPRHLVHLDNPDAPPRGISIALPDAPARSNAMVVSRIRFVDGGERAGGLVWRYRDASNFYAVAVDLQAREISLLRVMGGNRIRLDVSPDAALDMDAWHTIGVGHTHDQIKVHVDGINVLNARDPNPVESGRAGVWSSGRSLTWFDDIRVSDIQEQR